MCESKLSKVLFIVFISSILGFIICAIIQASRNELQTRHETLYGECPTDCVDSHCKFYDSNGQIKTGDCSCAGSNSDHTVTKFCADYLTETIHPPENYDVAHFVLGMILMTSFFGLITVLKSEQDDKDEEKAELRAVRRKLRKRLKTQTRRVEICGDFVLNPIIYTTCNVV